jgi:acetaldehyde dehydrogenase (acetylating)
VRRELPKNGAVFVTGEARAKLQRAMQDPRTGGVSGAIVGLSALAIAQRAGIEVPSDTRVLVVECAEVGPKEFFSREKLSPVLAYFVADGWEACCERSIELLQFGGLGHSLAIHSRDEQVIMRFFEEKPAFRILVNTMAAMGATGFTTGLVPAMTLGPGTWAGSSTSDNVGPMHLINIKRLAYEIRPYAPSGQSSEAQRAQPAQSVASDQRSVSKAPEPAFTPEQVRAMVDEFLSTHRAARGRA